MTFLLGRQAIFGQEPPIYFRSMTAVFIPVLARVHERSLPAAPLPRMTRSYSSTPLRPLERPGLSESSMCRVAFIFICFLHFRRASLNSLSAELHARLHSCRCQQARRAQ